MGLGNYRHSLENLDQADNIFSVSLCTDSWVWMNVTSWVIPHWIPGLLSTDSAEPQGSLRKLDLTAYNVAGVIKLLEVWIDF